jgi:hypothetical protein
VAVNLAVTTQTGDGTPADVFGIARRYAQQGDAYLFVVAPVGSMGLLKVANYCFTLISAFKSRGITRVGIGAVDTREVRAIGSRFECYTNNVGVGAASGSTYSTGVPGGSRHQRVRPPSLIST